MNEFAPLIHSRGEAARYSTYITSSLGRSENVGKRNMFSLRSSLDVIKVKVKERNMLFEKDPFNPVLNNHALHGKFSGMRSIDITGDYRAIFAENSGVVIFTLVGTHGELYGE